MNSLPRFAPLGLHHPLGLPQNDVQAKASYLAEKTKEKENTRSKNPFVTRLSMRKWDYDPALIIQHLDNRK